MDKDIIMRYKHVYVLCPPNSVTGGPDALHQMVYYLHGLGVNSSIAYISYLCNPNIISIQEPYKRYVDEYVCDQDIIDSRDIAIVIPEAYAYLSERYKMASVFIWWLSVDNRRIKYNSIKKLIVLGSAPFRYLSYGHKDKKHFMLSLKNRLKHNEYSFLHEKENVQHLCASYYALDIISKKTSNKYHKCIEPISKLFLEEYKKYCFSLKDDRNNIILYNPAKCGKFIQYLSSLYPQFEFLPLKGYTQRQLIEKYKEAKLYVDFGPFPGAERIPKEAVLYGCAIITGKHGASGYHGDVPINNAYKFDESEVDVISKQIQYVLDNYQTIYSDFDEYRQTILCLEEKYNNDLSAIFK